MAFRARKTAAAALTLLALMIPLRAGAEPSPQEKETARALMDQGDERFEEKNYAAALQAYAGAHAIMRVPTTALEVAKAQEALGNLVEARDALLEAVRYPKSPSEPAAYTAARVEAERHATLLGERIPSIVVKVDGLPRGQDLHVSVDGVALPPAAALLPIRVNPGRHRLVASSDVTHDASKDVELSEHQNITVALSLKARPASETTVAATSPESSGSTLRTVGMIGAGVGFAGLVVGTMFGLQASSKQDAADCPNNVCRDDAAASTLRAANDAATISTVAFIAGGVLTAGGATLWLLGSSRSSKTATVRLTPAGPAGLLAVGTF